MARKVRAAVLARTDPGFVIAARTDARAVEGLDAAIDRARAYVDAGADLIFPEALADEREFAAFRRAIAVPLLANMTEFGRSPLLSRERLEALGCNVVIYPMTAFRLAMRAVEDGLAELLAAGTAAGLVDRMQTRARLYEVVRYRDFERFDQGVARPEGPAVRPAEETP
jgi:methylisocitrate lyase